MLPSDAGRINPRLLLSSGGVRTLRLLVVSGAAAFNLLVLR